MRIAISLLVALATCISPLNTSPTAASSPLKHDAAAATEKSAVTTSSCAAVKPIFLMKNISTNIPDVPVSGSESLSMCPGAAENGSCCTAQMGERLRDLVRRDLQSVIRHSAMSLQGELSTNAAALADRLIYLTRRSENRTQELFANLYEKLAPQARAPVAVLYAELRRALSALPTPVSLNETSLDTEGAALEEAVNQFFSQLFPLVYRHSVTHASGDLSADYSVCLQATITEVRPFGETPHALATTVSRSLRATRVLLIALRFGVEALEATERVWERGDECGTALLRMSYCARCSGLATVKPCAGYCLNVLRGCLAHLAVLDSSWNGFVGGVEDFVRASRTPSALLNVESIMRTLDTRISGAIMYAMENGPSLERRVRIACGPAQWTESKADTSNATSSSTAVAAKAAWTPAAQEEPDIAARVLHGVLPSLVRSKGFYAGLADTLCSDDSFAETVEDADCWNGHRVAQYTRTVVGPSIGAQKYNPELAWNARHLSDPHVAHLNDRLLHIRQMLVTQRNMAFEFEADSLMMEQGSGSGQHVFEDDDDGDDDDGGDWGNRGSGSGDGGGPDFTSGGSTGGGSTKETGRKTGTGGGTGTGTTNVNGSHSARAGLPAVVWCLLLLLLSPVPWRAQH